MPIEIRELVVRTVVGGDNAGPSPGSRSGDRYDGHHDYHGHHGSSNTAPALDAAAFDLLVQECVRQVMLALARERER